MAIPTQFTCISLCSGIAGLDLGVKLACPGVVAACYVENEITAAEKLAARIEDGMLEDAPVWSDLKTFRGQAWRHRVDCIIAGYPCQPFSCAGKQKGEDDPRHLWPHVARIIREVSPEWVFLENVSNHLRLGFYEVARELRAMGYRVEAGLFSAAEIGAPHLRKRLFVLAHAAWAERQRQDGEARGWRWGIREASDDVADSARRGFRESCGNPGREGLTHGRGARLGDTAGPRRDGREGQGLRINRSSLQAARLAGTDRELADAGLGLVPLAGRGSRERKGTRPAGADVANAGRSARGGA